MIDRVAVPAAWGQPNVPWRRVAVGLAVVVVLIAVLALARGPAVSVHTGIATSAEGAISIEADGWTYGVSLDGVSWVDAQNTWHDSGRPDCLPATGATGPITFGAVEVTVEGTTWRPVVWVSCR